MVAIIFFILAGVGDGDVVMATFLILSSLLLLLLAAAASAAGEEDFAFETSPGEDDAQASSPSTSSSGHVRRHWGIPDVMVVTGKLLHVKVPADAFSGAVDHYEVSLKKVDDGVSRKVSHPPPPTTTISSNLLE